MGCIKTHASFGGMNLCQMQLSRLFNTYTPIYKIEYFNLLLTACVQLHSAKGSQFVCVFSVWFTIFLTR